MRRRPDVQDVSGRKSSIIPRTTEVKRVMIPGHIVLAR
jgi:hypothetical protein